MRYISEIRTVPEDISKSVQHMARIAKEVGFFQACIEAQAPHEIERLPQEAHSAATVYLETTHW